MHIIQKKNHIYALTQCLNVQIFENNLSIKRCSISNYYLNCNRSLKYLGPPMENIKCFVRFYYQSLKFGMELLRSKIKHNEITETALHQTSASA